MLDPVDGVVIRMPGPYRSPHQRDGSQEYAYSLEAAAITAYWVSTTVKAKGVWSNWGLEWAPLRDSRARLHYLFDAYIVNPQTQEVINNIYSGMKAGIALGAHVEHDPDCLSFLAGTLGYSQLLGTPAGKWVSELLLSYTNPSAGQLGHKLIAGVELWAPAAGLPTHSHPDTKNIVLVWDIVDYSNEEVQKSENELHAVGMS